MFHILLVHLPDEFIELRECQESILVLVILVEQELHMVLRGPIPWQQCKKIME
jgi:hypothetical protein